MTEVWLQTKQENLAGLKCRFGCDSPVIGIFHAPKGCVCWDDPVQALCAQHFETMQSSGPITYIVDFAKFKSE
jgi:hypothetical protein